MEINFEVSWEIMEEGERIHKSDEVTVQVTVTAYMEEGWTAEDVTLVLDVNDIHISPEGDQDVDTRIGLLEEAGDTDDPDYRAETYEALHHDEFVSAFITPKSSEGPLRYNLGEFPENDFSVERSFVLATGRSLDLLPAQGGHYSIPCEVEFVPVQLTSQTSARCTALDFEVSG